MRAARREMGAVDEVAAEPAPVVTPQLDGEGILLHCNYWLDFRAHNVDAIAADLARRLWVITESPAGGRPEAAPA